MTRVWLPLRSSMARRYFDIVDSENKSVPSTG
jgi:hypothetical protein